MLGLAQLDTWDVPFNPAIHGTDTAFDVFSATITETRVGDTITSFFKATVKNPGSSGIVTSAKRYYVLWEQRQEDDLPVELARGRIVPLPTGMADRRIDISFQCLPPKSTIVKKAAAIALRVREVAYDPDAPAADREAAEAYDPLFYGAAAEEDPDTALGGRPELWRWDRKTLALRRTHIVESDITYSIGADGLGQPPMLSINDPPRPWTQQRIVANWTQRARGQQSVAEQGDVTTFTYDDFIAGFPKAGSGIGSDTGWTLAKAEITSVDDQPAYWVSILDPKFGTAAGGMLQVRPKRISYLMTAAYDYQQQREEIIDIRLASGLQDVPADDEEVEPVDTVTLGSLTLDTSTPEWQYENPETLVRRHYVVGQEVLANGRAWTCQVEHDAQIDFMPRDPVTQELIWLRREKRAPIGTTRNPRFVDLPRGVRAIRHAIRRLKRQVLLRAQCAEVTFELPWVLSRNITTEDSCWIAHRSLPGGEMTGKVSSIELSIQPGGKRRGRITMLSIPGKGLPAGIPEEGEQQTADVVYVTDYRGVNIPVDAFALQAQSPRIFEFENEWGDQLAAANASSDPIAAIGANPTRLSIAFKALREEDLLSRRGTVICEPLPLPMQINLSPVM
ncbi:hypothetical protein [Pararhizobium sp.]|uniref:hypothetical protein n=1 Tax=Pararhizobium sp. TaxID=1977563 RepID=UPI003D117A53